MRPLPAALPRDQGSLDRGLGPHREQRRDRRDKAVEHDGNPLSCRPERDPRQEHDLRPAHGGGRDPWLFFPRDRTGPPQCPAHHLFLATHHGGVGCGPEANGLCRVKIEQGAGEGGGHGGVPDADLPQADQARLAGEPGPDGDATAR
jgi:hypothetical protein